MRSKRCYGCMQIKEQDPVCEHCGYDSRQANAPHQLPAGTILQGKYLIGRVLGQGGFGITYLGLDMNLNVPIAIKEYYPSGIVTRDSMRSSQVRVVLSNLNSCFVENRSRFLREAQMLAQLEDVPEVVQVKNFFQDNNTAYIIMGYVRGITLKEYMSLQGGCLKAAQVFDLLIPIMGALERVHGLGLVHRDISPDNIMIQSNGRVRLIDFGAAHTATNLSEKSTQAVMKHGFAPIEQYQNRGQLGSWTDVYALCATIYCCLTNKQPPNVTDRMMGEDDFYWDSVPGLSALQKAVLMEGLELHYASRIQSVTELRNRLFAEETDIDKGRGKTYQTGTVALEHGIESEYCSMPVSRQAMLRGGLNATQSKPSPKYKKSIRIIIALIVIVISVLLAGYFVDKPESGDRVLKEYFSESDAFMERIDKERIQYITFLDNTSVPGYALDVSDNQDGSVMAWVENSGTELYIAADGKVIAPKNCEMLFGNFKKVKKIQFLENFDTSRVENMNSMFYKCVRLQKIDLSGFDTSHVTDMGSMFLGCTALQVVNLTGWDTAKVEDMSYMFIGTNNLRNINLKFDVSSVIDYTGFMDRRDTVNGKIWEAIFY